MPVVKTIYRNPHRRSFCTVSFNYDLCFIDSRLIVVLRITSN